VLLAPGVFDQDDDGIVLLLKEIPDEDERAAVGESIRVCPASAIRVAG
jgi:ferredoxin